MLALAAFDPTDAFQANVNIGVMHDNNLFRLPDADPRLFGVDPNNKSDTAFIKGVGLKYDKVLSRQRLIADLSLSETTFDKNTDLDYTGYDGRLAWMWRIGNDWDGEASYRKRKTLGGFADELLKVQDLVESEWYRFTAGYQVDARWRVSGELNKDTQSHSAANQRSLDVDSKTAGVGVMYRTPADNSIGLQARRTDREYPNRTTLGLNNNHTEDRINLVGLWRVTGITRLDLQAGHVDVSHDQFPDRDFSGFTWRAAGIWDATGKFRMSVAGYKDVRLYEDRETDYIVVHGISITPIYVITSKITVQGDFLYERRDFRPITVREDNFRLAKLGVTYSPLRNVDLTLSFETGERKSNVVLGNISVFSYDYQAWFGTAKISF